jgi:DNA repair exonuclease SbcCD ATPase subunit
MTLKDIAKQLDVPESSLRKYRELFNDFIPGVGTGRSRRYRAEAVDVLKDIRDMREEQHLPWDAITENLAGKYPIDATPKGAGPAQTTMPLETGALEVERSSAAASDAKTAAAVTGNGGNLMAKFLAMNEKQTMVVNAIALQMLKAVEMVREEARAENRQLRENISRAIGSLAAAMNASAGRDRESIEQIKKQLDAIEENIEKISEAGDSAADVARVKEELRVVRARLAQKENAVEEIKKSVEVLKKENASLREFKSRHLEHCEENTREAKAMKKASPIKRLLGIKP